MILHPDSGELVVNDHRRSARRWWCCRSRLGASWAGAGEGPMQAWCFPARAGGAICTGRRWVNWHGCGSNEARQTLRHWACLAGGLLLAGAAWVCSAHRWPSRWLPAWCRRAGRRCPGQPARRAARGPRAPARRSDERRFGPAPWSSPAGGCSCSMPGGSSTRNLARMGFLHGRIDIVLTHFHLTHRRPGRVDAAALGGRAQRRAGAGVGPPGVEPWWSVNQATRPTASTAWPTTASRPCLPPWRQAAQVVTLGRRWPRHGLARGRPGDHCLQASTTRAGAPGAGLPHPLRDPAWCSAATSEERAVQREATGADLLLHEALSPRLGLLRRGRPALAMAAPAKVFADIVDYHSTPEEVGGADGPGRGRAPAAAQPSRHRCRCPG